MMFTVLDDANSVSNTQAIFFLREQGKEKVHEDNISDQLFFFFWCLQEIWGYFPVGMYLVL